MVNLGFTDYEHIATKQREILIDKIMKEKNVSCQNAVLILNHYPIIENQLPIKCKLCQVGSTPVPAGKGIILKECLHYFCKQCLSKHIQSCNTADIRCPFVDGEDQCQETLTPSEVEKLVSKMEYERHYVHLRLKEAESQIPNALHCRKANCQGFCYLEDSTRQFFTCPVCSTRNCRISNQGQGQQDSQQNHNGGPQSCSKNESCKIL